MSAVRQYSLAGSFFEGRQVKRKRQRGQRRQKDLFASFALFAFFASLHPTINMWSGGQCSSL
jgi:hypothetical protein